MCEATEALLSWGRICRQKQLPPLQVQSKRGAASLYPSLYPERERNREGRCRGLEKQFPSSAGEQEGWAEENILARDLGTVAFVFLFLYPKTICKL